MVVQRLGIHLPMQRSRAWSLVWEYSACLGATKPVGLDYWAWALEPVLCDKRSHHNDKPKYHKKDTVQSKINKLKKIFLSRKPKNSPKYIKGLQSFEYWSQVDQVCVGHYHFPTVWLWASYSAILGLSFPTEGCANNMGIMATSTHFMRLLWEIHEFRQIRIVPGTP